MATTTVASAYPSLNYTVLNATGYVVPQRKAALASKAQGRLEWLGVLEGSRVKAGEVVARLESKDVRAALDQASAQIKPAVTWIVVFRIGRVNHSGRRQGPGS